MGKQNSGNTNLKTIVVGCTPLARKSIELISNITNLVGIVNLHPELGLKKSNYDPMANFRLSRPNDCFLTRDINDDETVEWISSRNPDLIIQCGWSQIFKKKILSIPKKCCIGIHPSPLPVGRGAAILNWKIIESNGKTIPWGNSLFVMEPSTDTGDVLDFEPFNISPRDDIRTAYLKADKTSLTMLKRTLLKMAKWRSHSCATRFSQSDKIF